MSFFSSYMHQNQFLQQNIYFALALFGARFESLKSYDEQFQFVFNESDQSIMKDNFGRVLANNELKKITMEKQCNERQLLSKEDYQTFKQSSQR